MQETAKKILYIGNFDFPKNNAAGLRVLANGYLFKQLGFKVSFFGLSKTSTLANDKLELHNFNHYDSFDYINHPYPKGIKEWVFFGPIQKKIYYAIETLKPDAVVLYGSPSNFVLALLLTNYCKKRKITVITDCVDWLSGGSGSIPFRIGKWIDTEIQKRYVNTKANGVIVVSSFLKNYYEKKGCVTLTLPPLASDTDEVYVKNKNNQDAELIRLVYAGNPFPTTRKITSEKAIKDRIDKAVEILYKVKEDKFRFDVYGISKEEYLRAIPKHEFIIDQLRDLVVFHGRISNEVVKREVACADFYFLIRDKSKMCDAGFPSKITESISLGTPIICTDTSDIRKYLPDGEMAYYLPSDNLEIAAEMMTKILKKDRSSVIEMSNFCMLTKPFDPEKYHESSMNFFSAIGLVR